MQAKALLNTMAFAPEQAKTNDLFAFWEMWRPRWTLWDSLSDVDAAALAETMADS